MASPPPTLTRRRQIRFNNVTYHDKNVAVPLQSRELTKLFKGLASANGFAMSDLMANEAILPGVALNCRRIERFPTGYSFMTRDKGYIIANIRGSRTAVGHSFWGGDDACEECDPTCAAPRLKKGETLEPASPRRNPARLSSPQSMPDPPLTPDSAEGQSHPMLIRLHRAAALAASSHPTQDANKWGVLHICGYKNCGVVGHYRPGTHTDNKADEKHHLKHPGTSRKRYAPWQ